MKKIMLLVIVSSLFLVLAAGASANTAARLRVNVPFAFHIGSDTVPAGEYIFEMRAISAFAPSNSLVVVWDKKGFVVGMTASMPGVDKDFESAKIHFNRYNTDYFLSSVVGAGFQADIRPTPLEKELRAGMKQVHQETLVAEQ